jgi:hypothetical protein
MSLGKTPPTEDSPTSSARLCEPRVAPNSIYALLYREGHHLFPDELFADLFADIGRYSVPPRITAIVMVLQRLEGSSDREAVEHFTFDLRWKYACGGLSYDYDGFVHTVLVDMRARLRESQRPTRIFEVSLDIAKQAGRLGRKRVLDSTALYDAVTTQDTVTLIRSAIRGLLRDADAELAQELRACCKRDDDYQAPGKPSCDWEDAQAREALIDALAHDAQAILAALDNRPLKEEVMQAAQLLAAVVGQDLEQSEQGMFRIARRVAKDRVISTVDPQARHGHKTAARGFDGYKGHLAVDPDSELITATAVTAGNVADGEVGEQLLAEVLNSRAETAEVAVAQPVPELVVQLACEPASGEATCEPVAVETPHVQPNLPSVEEPAGSASEVVEGTAAATMEREPGPVPHLECYGDAAYGNAKLIERVEAAGGEANFKVQVARGRDGKFGKEQFDIDLEKKTVTCPAGRLVVIGTVGQAGATVNFGEHCKDCPLREQCTQSKQGRTIHLHPKEETLQRHRRRQRSPNWKQRYRATRPKVERKIGQLMRRRHGGRRLRMRGCERNAHDFAMLGAAHNLKRLATLGLHREAGTWKC